MFFEICGFHGFEEANQDHTYRSVPGKHPLPGIIST